MTEPKQNQLTIAGSLTIYEVESQVTQWQTQLASGLPQTICMQDLTELDGAGFQAILSLAKTLQKLSFNGNFTLPTNTALANWLKPKLALIGLGGCHA